LAAFLPGKMQLATLAEPNLELTDDRLAARNAVVLAIAQALAGANTTVVVATGAIAGSMLAPDPALATLPISVMIVGMWMGTLPVGMLTKAFGRRSALQVGSAFGVLSGLISCLAMMSGLFVLLLGGALCAGFYAAAHQSYRFAAADTASVRFRAKAIAWVLAGGVWAAILGPQLVIFTKNIWPDYLFAATYLGQSAFAILAAAVLSFLKMPSNSVSGAGFGDGRPLIEFAQQPRFIVAVACGVASFLVMNLLMTSAPLAMVTCNHSVSDAALGIQWHVIGMYAPSFFTGTLVIRYGVSRLMAAGFALIFAAAAVNLLGPGLWNFWISLFLLGVGWNFAFIAATTLLTDCHGPRERNKVQAFNDFLVFGSTAMGSFFSGALLSHWGWAVVNATIFPVVVGVAVLLFWNSRVLRPNTL
jgi:MFS family permease